MVVPPNLEITPPDTQGIDFAYVDGVLRLDTSIAVKNNGYYFGGFAITPDITNFTISVRGLVEDIEVTNVTSDPVDIPIGTSRLVPVSVGVQLAPLVSTGYIIFEPANITFILGGDATTTRGLLDVAVSVTLGLPMEEPLISDFNFDFQNSTFANITGGKEWRFPYTIRSADIIQGNASAVLTLLNQTGGFIGNTTTDIPLGTDAMGNLTFAISDGSFLELMTGPQDLALQVQLTLPGDLTFSREVTIPWEPPGGG